MNHDVTGHSEFVLIKICIWFNNSCPCGPFLHLIRMGCELSSSLHTVWRISCLLPYLFVWLFFFSFFLFKYCLRRRFCITLIFFYRLTTKIFNFNGKFWQQILFTADSYINTSCILSKSKNENVLFVVNSYMCILLKMFP